MSRNKNEDISEDNNHRGHKAGMEIRRTEQIPVKTKLVRPDMNGCCCSDEIINLTAILIAEGTNTISFKFEDLVRYHGTRSICGLTVAFKVMEAAWNEIWKQNPPSRDSIDIHSGFPGSGARDGFEMVTRAVTRNAYHVLPDIQPGPLVAEAAKGAYFFRFSDGKQVIEMGLKPSVVPDTFVPHRRCLASGNPTARQKGDFRALQLAFSSQLRALPPLEAVNVIDIRPASI